ncbi:hypothetical protein ACTFIV_001475 [Dictyostelium citrinum]
MICFIAATAPAFNGFNDYNVSDTTHHYYLSLNRVDVSFLYKITDAVQIESCSYSFIKLNGNCGDLPCRYFVAQIAISIYVRHHQSELSENYSVKARLFMLLVFIASVGCFVIAHY